MILGAKGQNAVHACMIRHLNLRPASIYFIGGKKSFAPKVSQIRKTGIYKCITLILTIQSMYIL